MSDGDRLIDIIVRNGKSRSNKVLLNQADSTFEEKSDALSTSIV